MKALFSPPVPTVSFNELYQGARHLLLLSPRLKKLSEDDLYDHVCWYWNHGTLSWAQKPEGEYCGICLIKLIDDIADMDIPYVHIPDGRGIVIEEVVSDGPATWKTLFEQLYDIWGAREYLIWDRRDRTKHAPRVYSWRAYLKILKRLTNGYSP